MGWGRDFLREEMYMVELFFRNILFMRKSDVSN